jgi:hypothetical protein
VPLPIELADIGGNKVQGLTTISWVTASEASADFFEVQKSYDAISFAKIGKVPTMVNSTTRHLKWSTLFPSSITS